MISVILKCFIDPTRIKLKAKQEKLTESRQLALLRMESGILKAITGQFTEYCTNAVNVSDFVKSIREYPTSRPEEVGIYNKELGQYFLSWSIGKKEYLIISRGQPHKVCFRAKKLEELEELNS